MFFLHKSKGMTERRNDEYTISHSKANNKMHTTYSSIIHKILHNHKDTIGDEHKNVQQQPTITYSECLG